MPLLQEVLVVAVHPDDVAGEMSWLKGHGARLNVNVVLDETVPRGLARVDNPDELTRRLREAGYGGSTQRTDPRR